MTDGETAALRVIWRGLFTCDVINIHRLDYLGGEVE